MGEIVKEDLEKLEHQVDFLKKEVLSIRESITSMKSLYLNFLAKELQQREHQQQTGNIASPAHKSQREVNNCLFKPLKANILGISIGNGGVPADRQTDQQTDKNKEILKKDSLKEASKLLESLDDIRKEIRLKFKQLTEQEFLVFSTIYQLEEEKGPCDYRTLAIQLRLTESSIRDYVVKLIKKGIPIEKTKVKNKSVTLSISKNLKRISTLPTIFQLRNM